MFETSPLKRILMCFTYTINILILNQVPQLPPVYHRVLSAHDDLTYMVLYIVYNQIAQKRISLAHPSTPSLKHIIAETTQIVPSLNKQRQLIEIGQ